jgi:hypothetical protein
MRRKTDAEPQVWNECSRCGETEIVRRDARHTESDLELASGEMEGLGNLPGNRNIQEVMRVRHVGPRERSRRLFLLEQRRSTSVNGAFESPGARWPTTLAWESVHRHVCASFRKPESAPRYARYARLVLTWALVASSGLAAGIAVTAAGFDFRANLHCCSPSFSKPCENTRRFQAQPATQLSL